MDIPPEPKIDCTPPVLLDQHESVRYHVRRRLSDEVARLERRIEVLRLNQAPHSAIIISTYERMIDRKKGFMENWGMDDTSAY